VLSEDETLARAASGINLARFGDGELRIAAGGDCISQRERFPKLVEELTAMLMAPREGCMVCIPNVDSPTPKAVSWAHYRDRKFVGLYGPQEFGSSFITRPDSAPWIDTPEYWDKVRDLWRGKDVVLVVGDKKSITTEMIGMAASSVREVLGPRQNAYREIDRIEDEIGTTSGAVLMCMGVTATVLAWRLAAKGVHAIDLGHIGMFMKHAGAYRYVIGDLISPAYRKQIHALHASQSWGGDGAKHTAAVKAFAGELGATTILDYGCGRGELAKSMAPQRVSQFDPAIPGNDGMPKPCDLVVCTDVLEHVEPDKLDAVMDHIHRLAGKGAYLTIATRPANAVLPDGRNAHLIVEDAPWWIARIERQGWKIHDVYEKPNFEVRLCLHR
jgi:hypothetical protein